MIRKKMTLAALGLAALIAGSAAAPALAHDRDHFSFGIAIGDPGYRPGPSYWEREHWRHERWEREHAYREWRHREWEREHWRDRDRWHRWHDGW